MKKLLIGFTLSLIILLAACDTAVAEENITVSFVTNSDAIIEDIELSEGDVLVLPEEPIKEGHEFKYWYYDVELTERYSSNDVLTEDITLYAEWDIEAYTIRIYDFDGDLQSTIIQEFGYELASLYLLGYQEIYMEPSIESERIIAQTLGASDLDVYAIAPDGPIVIGANIYTFNDNYMNGVLRPELERYASEIGVEIQIVDSDAVQAVLNDQVDTFIEMEVDVLLINLVDPSSADIIIDKAQAAGIPLVFYQRTINAPSILDEYEDVWSVSDDVDSSGRMQGEMIVDHWNNGLITDRNGNGVIDYVLLKGEPGHPYAESRTFWVIESIMLSGLTTNELDIAYSPYWGSADADNFMTNWLDMSFADDIDVVIANNDGMAFGALNALQNAGLFIPVYGIDGLEEALWRISDDEMMGTVKNSGVQVAQASIDIAINMVLGNDVFEGNEYSMYQEDTNKVILIPYLPIDKSNVDEHQ